MRTSSRWNKKNASWRRACCSCLLLSTKYASHQTASMPIQPECGRIRKQENTMVSKLISWTSVVPEPMVASKTWHCSERGSSNRRLYVWMHQQRDYGGGGKCGFKRCNSLRHFAPAIPVFRKKDRYIWNLRRRVLVLTFRWSWNACDQRNRRLQQNDLHAIAVGWKLKWKGSAPNVLTSCESLWHTRLCNGDSISLS